LRAELGVLRIISAIIAQIHAVAILGIRTLLVSDAAPRHTARHNTGAGSDRKMFIGAYRSVSIAYGTEDDLTGVNSMQ